MDLFTQRLDASLGSGSSFGSKERVEEIVKQQLLHLPLLDDNNDSSAAVEACLQDAVTMKTNHMWEVLQSLRAASRDKEWKLEEQTQTMKVRYCQGEGTPYHSYCIDGVMDAPLAHALFVIWEVPCFKTWWPRFTVPAFKVLESRWLKRLRVCENLFYMRCRVPWPIAARELVVTNFEVEDPEEEVVVGCLRSVDSSEALKENVHGYESKHLPPPKEGVVRMEANGGFIIQKISENKCYIRALIHLDLKLDYVPPWIINFIGRQLIGHGFKLYVKTVLSIKENGVSLKSMDQQPLYRKIQTQAGRNPKQ